MATLVARPTRGTVNPNLLQRFRDLDSSTSLALIVGFAFALRLIVVLIVFRGIALPSEDHAQFGWEMGWVARSLSLSRGFSSPFAPLTGPTALVPPLYPYVLAGIFRIFGLYSQGSALVTLVLNSALSALTCIPVYFLARQIDGERTGRRAAWLWAFYPFAIYFSATRVWDYSLTALLLACCWWMAHTLHRTQSLLRSVGFGLLYGLAALSNPSILSLFPIALALRVWRIRELGGPWVRSGCLTALSAVLVIAPWTVRNHRILHADVPLRDGFWLECWAGNHGDVFTSNPADAHPASNEAEMSRYAKVGEVGYVAEKRALAITYVRSHPGATLIVTVRRAVRFWTGFWSFNPAYLRLEPLDVPNLLFCSSITLLMFLGIRRYWRENWKAALPSILLLLLFPVPYYLSHASMDYRQPIEPIVIVLVAIGCSGAGAFFRRGLVLGG